jgi:tetratricopeptide (TPR) repeat protein
MEGDHFQQAEIFRLEGKLEASLEEYTKALEATPKEDKARISLIYNNRGNAKYRLVNFMDAIDDYSKAIEANPSFGIAYFNRGQVRYRLGFLTEAEIDLKKSLELDPNFPEAVAHLELVQQNIASKQLK